jgi:hypothetical protein
MNKLDVNPRTFALSPVSHSVPNPAPRLIVLFPASETDTPDLEHRIWEIARSLKLSVLLLGLTNDFDEESRLRRKLITMAAVIKDPYVSTEIMIEHGSDWVRQVKKVWMEGDILACYTGQKVGLMRKPLDQVLKSSMNATIYPISDYHPAQHPNSTFISKLLLWLGSLAIIGGFLWAEIKIVQLPQDLAHNVLIYACIVVEIVFIWLWNFLLT